MTQTEKINEINKEISELENSLKDVKGTDCEVYTRIVGYHRAVTSWNKGKAEEYYDRKTFDVSSCSCSGGVPLLEKRSTDNKEKSYSDITKYIFFYTSSCIKCPAVKKVLSDSPIKGLWIDGLKEENREVIELYGVMSVPTVVFLSNTDEIIVQTGNIDEIKSILDFKIANIA